MGACAALGTLAVGVPPVPSGPSCRTAVKPGGPGA